MNPTSKDQIKFDILLSVFPILTTFVNSEVYREFAYGTLNKTIIEMVVANGGNRCKSLPQFDNQLIITQTIGLEFIGNTEGDSY